MKNSRGDTACGLVYLEAAEIRRVVMAGLGLTDIHLLSLVAGKGKGFKPERQRTLGTNMLCILLESWTPLLLSYHPINTTGWLLSAGRGNLGIWDYLRSSNTLREYTIGEVGHLMKLLSTEICHRDRPPLVGCPQSPCVITWLNLGRGVRPCKLHVGRQIQKCIQFPYTAKASTIYHTVRQVSGAVLL